MSGYAELHCISNFTFLRGASHPGELVQRAFDLGYRALALTDECSVAGVVRAHTAARELGLHLIIGSEFILENGDRLILIGHRPGRLSAVDTADYYGPAACGQRSLPPRRQRPLCRFPAELPCTHCE